MARRLYSVATSPGGFVAGPGVTHEPPAGPPADLTFVDDPARAHLRFRVAR